MLPTAYIEALEGEAWGYTGTHGRSSEAGSPAPSCGTSLHCEAQLLTQPLLSSGQLPRTDAIIIY